VAQGVGPEFKPQYHKKMKINLQNVVLDQLSSFIAHKYGLSQICISLHLMRLFLQRFLSSLYQ
jgi:hypothetical protein